MLACSPERERFGAPTPPHVLIMTHPPRATGYHVRAQGSRVRPGTERLGALPPLYFHPILMQATTCERKVRVYDLETDTESYIPEGETLISMSLSRDGRHLLVNLTRWAQRAVHAVLLAPACVLRVQCMRCRWRQLVFAAAAGGTAAAWWSAWPGEGCGGLGYGKSKLAVPPWPMWAGLPKRGYQDACLTAVCALPGPRLAATRCTCGTWAPAPKSARPPCPARALRAAT